MEKWFGFYPVRKELEARISGLENEKAELLREKENIAKENTRLLASKEWLTTEK
ncbi:hypothetical protein MMM109_02490 [Helicobacter pylori]